MCLVNGVYDLQMVMATLHARHHNKQCGETSYCKEILFRSLYQTYHTVTGDAEGGDIHGKTQL